MQLDHLKCSFLATAEERSFPKAAPRLGALGAAPGKKDGWSSSPPASTPTQVTCEVPELSAVESLVSGVVVSER